MLSSNSPHISHTLTGRMDAGPGCQTYTTASLGASHLSGGVRGWQASQVPGPSSWLQAPEVGLRRHRLGCGQLYNRIKMLYKEGHEPEPVLTHGTEDSILIISNLFPPCLKHEFSYPQQSNHITN